MTVLSNFKNFFSSTKKEVSKQTRQKNKSAAITFIASIYCLTPDYILNQTADWLVWAHKNAMELETRKIRILFSALTGQDLTCQHKQGDDTELKKIGLGK